MKSTEAWLIRWEWMGDHAKVDQPIVMPVTEWIPQPRLPGQSRYACGRKGGSPLRRQPFPLG